MDVVVTAGPAPARGRLALGNARYDCALGRSGVTDRKREGDGATPQGCFPLRRVLYRADRLPRPRTALETGAIAPEDAWCDDPEHADYNRAVRLPHPGRHETLWREDGLYDVVVILGYNDDPVVKGRGSAIFLHVARPDLAPTEGCVALLLPDLLDLLARVDRLARLCVDRRA